MPRCCVNSAGADEPRDLDARVSRADEWITKVLEKVGVKGGLEEEKVKETWRDAGW